MGWLVAGIGALVGAIGGGIGAAKDADNAREAAEAQKKYLKDQYNLQKKEAELQFNKAKEEANRNAQKANLQADLTDQAQDISERTLSNDFNAAIDNLYLSQASDTYQWNQQAMANGASTGASYAGLAASGVRAGSSMSDAVEMQAATNAELLQFSQDSKRRSDNNNLGSVLNQLAGNEFNIMENRIGADETRKDALALVNSYLEGGYNYNIYQNNLDQMKNTYKYNKKQLDNTIDANKGWNKFLKVATGSLTGGASGLQTGYNVYDTYQKAKEYKTTL